MKGSGGGGANQVDVVVGMDNPKTNVYVTHCEIQFCLVAVLGGGGYLFLPFVEVFPFTDTKLWLPAQLGCESSVMMRGKKMKKNDPDVT